MTAPIAFGGDVMLGRGVGDVLAGRAARTIDVDGAALGLVGFADHPSDFAAAAGRRGIAWIAPAEGMPQWLADEVGRVWATCAGEDHDVVARRLVAASRALGTELRREEERLVLDLTTQWGT